MEVRHFLDIDRVGAGDLRRMIDKAALLKSGLSSTAMSGRTLAMIFEKPSTRTRVSFEVAARQLGGDPIVLTSGDMQLGRGETIADTARVLSRYVDAIMIRTTGHDRLLELAEHATVPVINALTDRSHPCQVMADIMTIEEHRGPVREQKLAWTGDGNNMVNSLVHAAERFGFELSIATPPELQPDPEVIDWARSGQARVHVTRDPIEAVRDADAVLTDTWVSMGDGDAEQRKAWLAPYQVDRHLMSKAKDSAIFLHCLPAHREEEVTAEVIDGPQSVVFDEAENRLHAQKAILAWCLES